MAPEKEKAPPKNEKEREGTHGKKKVEAVVTPPPPPPPTPAEVLERNVMLLEKFAASHDARFLSRVLRYTAYVRQRLPLHAQAAAAEAAVADAGRRAAVMALFGAAEVAMKVRGPQRV